MTTLETTPRTEIAPSEVRAEEPTFARLIGAVGLSATLLGLVAIVANQYGPRFIGTGGGYFFVAVGLAALLFHAISDGDVEFRRAFGTLGMLFFLGAIVAAFIPGPLFAESVTKTAGYHLLPWTPTFALIGLAFLVAPLRRETDANFKNGTLLLFLLTGILLCGGCVVEGIIAPESLVGPGILLAFVGLAYFAAFISNADSTSGLGYWLAVGLGLLGAAALAYALGRAIFPTVLFEGPNAIRNAFQKPDPWKVTARVAIILAFLGLAAWGALVKSYSKLARCGLVLFGLAFAGVIAYGCFAHPVTDVPKIYFVPYGLLLGLIGLIYLAVSLACASDSAFVALVRREIAAFFFSPIAYILLFGMALVSAFGHLSFLSQLGERGVLPEPIVQDDYALMIIAAFGVLFAVPALTMRAFSEEKRNATLEVLLTAPIGETSIVLSKFISCWLMYMLTFLPAGLYLIALRVEGGSVFDYRPLLSYYIAVACCGVGFVGMGLFFSSLTKNQIVAAAIAFAGMIFLLLTVWFRRSTYLGEALQTLLGRFDFLTLWQQALSGVLTLSQGITYISFGVFWLFLTVKVLEARKWG